MNDKDYTASSIKVLKGLEAVRKRPGMYIGDTEDGSGLHHMAYEVVDNSIDEVMAGYCSTISITINEDNSMTISDDGRGIPTDWHIDESMSAAKVIMTQLHAGGKFDHSSYKISGGLHGVGVSVVNALSAKLQLRIWRNGQEYYMEFMEGLSEKDLELVGSADKNGTEITFWPNSKIFSEIKFDFQVLYKRLLDLAFLNPKVTIILKDNRNNQQRQETMHYEGGVRSCVEYIDRQTSGLILAEPISFNGEKRQIKINCALQWNSGYSERITCFTNNVKQRDGGTHLSGLKAGLTRCINNYIQNFVNNKSTAQQKIDVLGDDVREGMTCVLSILMSDPKFSSQTKDKLVSSEVRIAVEGFIYDELSSWLAEYPKQAKLIIQRIVQAAHSREAARKARDLSRKKSLLDVAYLPGKLADCQTKDVEKTELLIVEGNSAGGTAKLARDRFCQAVLPMRGKMLNVEKAQYGRMLSSGEIGTLITVLGTGIGEEEFNIDKLRYHKIILMTDADVDGAHIRTLLLTFFFRYMLSLIEAGYLYVLEPPLYKITQGKSFHYLKDQAAADDFFIQQGLKKSKIYQRDKLLNVDTYLNHMTKLSYQMNKLLQSFAHNYSIHILEQVLWCGSWCGEKSQLVLSESAQEQLLTRLNSLSHEGEGDWSVELTPERLRLSRQVRGVLEEFVLKNDFYQQAISQELLKLVTELKDFYATNLMIKYKSDHACRVKGVVDFIKKLYDIGQDGVNKQRYKGLGEMNADQLWDTTLNPEIRVLKRITIYDMAETENMFSVLMGNEVLPRRTFIEENATQVSNLDI